MAKFQFKEGLILDFGTVQFEVFPDDPDFMETLESESKRMQEVSRKQQATGRNDSGIIRESCEEALKSIDSIIGEGASAEIFAGRPVRFFDILDVLSYIVQENKAFWARRREETAPAPANREQRRAATKATKPAMKKVPVPPVSEEA